MPRRPRMDATDLQGSVADAPNGVGGSSPTDPEIGAAEAFAEWAGVGKKRRLASISSSALDRILAETRVAMKTGDWTDLNSRHVFAYWAIAHELVYGVAPVTTGAERAQAAMRMGAAIKRHFDGDVGKAADYLRWLWTRERGREEWRRREGTSRGASLGWRMMFLSALVTEYRVDGARVRT